MTFLNLKKGRRIMDFQNILWKDYVGKTMEIKKHARVLAVYVTFLRHA